MGLMRLYGNPGYNAKQVPGTKQVDPFDKSVFGHYIAGSIKLQLCRRVVRKSNAQDSWRCPGRTQVLRPVETQVIQTSREYNSVGRMSFRKCLRAWAAMVAARRREYL